ncbi:hypothetical protein ASPZODRAFT_121247 [Penicilliopsis zonata CBS 506.65]|uniref:Ca2+-modulated nonselective cation channel polycystin n=1 Tax=Penicilliopsis zonata CBS 506.65 TaxID=1073090 RepID=A0A1L9SCB6_9EURO|nr:hypothetical protein ASPZODRAFT_121247 [Penicilliopsis zonata CBS 506.65]OJJ44794.1 hypothetical protein ASPZODRAFT_121247 [Penicilliopsis zonata CBS 506.65]
MATMEAPARPHDRNERRRPFSNWMKRLANLKNSSSSESNTIRWSHKRSAVHKDKKSPGKKHSPYHFHESSDRYGRTSRSQSDPSITCSAYESRMPAMSAKSRAPTISTNGGDTTISEAAYSKAGTFATGGGGISSTGGGEGSTFSSPAPSVRSLTTTLTTVQSAAPSTQLYANHNTQQGPSHASSIQNGLNNNSSNNQQVQFSHQFPSSPVSAVPPHLTPHGHSATYTTATANNLLTDNASILTLASSSKRRRRNSLDTNASIRALAPSSVFGGSRESLPLSVLSSNVGEPLNTPGMLNRPSLVGLASNERTSIYSASGVAPLVSGGGERTSFHATRQGATDGASIKSGIYSHTRNDSVAASVTGWISSSLPGPTNNISGRVSRRSSGWGEIPGVEGDRRGEQDEEESDVHDEKSEGQAESRTPESSEANEQDGPSAEMPERGKENDNREDE